MAVNTADDKFSAYQKVNEWNRLRGFTNLLHKENRAWWGARRWWINALLWTIMLAGLVSIMLFMLPGVGEATNNPDLEAAGGPIPFAMQMGLSALFELGGLALAVGVIILCQDMIIDERKSGVAEWLLAKPVQRRAYILAKVSASLVAVSLLLIALPAIVTYGLFYLRSGQPYPLLPYLSGVGLLALHSLFYLTLTILLGTIFETRSLVLGIALGMLLGGNILASLLKPLVYFTPWMLVKISALIAGSQPAPGGLIGFTLITTTLWSVLFVILALFMFERTEF